MPPSPQIHHFEEVYFFRVSFSPPRKETHLPNDLEGLRVNGVTVPPGLALTAQKPDLVIIKRGTKEVFLVELTVPWDCPSNMAAAVQRKSERYQGLASAIEENGFKCFNTPLEIGTRGVINQSRPQSLVPVHEDQEDQQNPLKRF